MNLGDILGNVASGGVLGLVGSIGTGVVSIFQAKNQYTHDERMAEISKSVMELQGKIASEADAAKFKQIVEQGADTNFQASQAAASAVNNLPPLAAGALAFVRPTILAALTVVVVWIYPDATPEMKALITQVVVQSWALGISWYFGSRQMLQFMPSKPAASAPAANP